MSEDEHYQFKKEIKPACNTYISKKVLSHLNTKYAIPVRCWE